MSVPEPPLTGEPLLVAVTESMVALHEHYHHLPPGSARTQLLGGDLLAVVMGEVYTEVEKTMIELRRGAQVREIRGAFGQAMEQRFTAEVERLSGREVLAFLSDSHVGPDLEVQLFVLEAGGPDRAQRPPGRER